MQAGWVRWVAYLVLAALVLVTSCQAWNADGPASVAATTTAATATAG